MGPPWDPGVDERVPGVVAPPLSRAVRDGERSQERLQGILHLLAPVLRRHTAKAGVELLRPGLEPLPKILLGKGTKALLAGDGTRRLHPRPPRPEMEPPVPCVVAGGSPPSDLLAHSARKPRCAEATAGRAGEDLVKNGGVEPVVVDLEACRHISSQGSRPLGQRQPRLSRARR